jgi:hypothetical protein
MKLLIMKVFSNLPSFRPSSVQLFYLVLRHYSGILLEELRKTIRTLSYHFWCPD